MPDRVATVGRVGLLGAGVIGGGWAARFLLSGIDVLLHDPDHDAERNVGEMLANARLSWSRLTMAPLPEPGSLTVVEEVEDAVPEVDFVQESAPEREDVVARGAVAGARHPVPRPQARACTRATGSDPQPDDRSHLLGRHATPGGVRTRPHQAPQWLVGVILLISVPKK